MPRPTNPPWSGSWPEPPPDTSATLPETGPPARVTSIWVRSVRMMSGWALPKPARLSGTTSATSLMSFFIGQSLLAAWRSGRGRFRPLAADELVQEGADEAAHGRADEVDDDELLDGHRSRPDGLAEEGGPDLAGGVERRARDGPDEDDDPVDDEADDQAGEARRRLARHGRTEHGEHEDGGPDDLGREA